MHAKISGKPTRLLTLLTLASGFAVAALPALADPEGEVSRDVRVKVIQCEDGDCAELTGNMAGGEDVEVLVGDDTAQKIILRKVHCDGDDCEQHHSETHNMIFVGEDGDVQVVSGDGAHAWVGHHGAGGGYLGVGLTELTPELREHFGVPAGAGVMVSKVTDSSPAAKAGLEAGDIIASVDDQTVASARDLARAIRARGAGDAVVLNVWRNGVSSSITAAVEERELVGRHGRHFDHGAKKVRKIMVRCDSDDENCASNLDAAGLDDFDCAGAGECEVEVECKNGGCECTVNGEDTDCAGIPGVPGR